MDTKIITIIMLKELFNIIGFDKKKIERKILNIF